MKMADNSRGYGWLSVLLHWAVAGLIASLLVVAIYANSLSRDAGRPLRYLHVSLGLTLLPLYCLRVYWRAAQGKPATVHHRRHEQMLAELAWRFLLIAPALMLATGPFLAWLHGRPVSFFDLFAVAPPMGPDHALRDQLFRIHSWLGYGIGAVAVLHACGALKHLLVYRDGVAQRMLRPTAAIESPSAAGETADGRH